MRIQHCSRVRSLIRFFTLCSLCTVLAVSATAAPLRPTHAPHAIVTSVHELASRAGVEMLRSGGNAIDAALAREERLEKCRCADAERRHDSDGSDHAARLHRRMIEDRRRHGKPVAAAILAGRNQ